MAGPHASAIIAAIGRSTRRGMPRGARCRAGRRPSRCDAAVRPRAPASLTPNASHTPRDLEPIERLSFRGSARVPRRYGEDHPALELYTWDPKYLRSRACGRPAPPRARRAVRRTAIPHTLLVDAAVPVPWTRTRDGHSHVPSRSPGIREIAAKRRGPATALSRLRCAESRLRLRRTTVPTTRTRARRPRPAGLRPRGRGRTPMS